MIRAKILDIKHPQLKSLHLHAIRIQQYRLWRIILVDRLAEFRFLRKSLANKNRLGAQHAYRSPHHLFDHDLNFTFAFFIAMFGKTDHHIVE